MHASRSGLRRHLHHRNVLSRYTGYDANITRGMLRASPPGTPIMDIPSSRPELNLSGGSLPRSSGTPEVKLGECGESGETPAPWGSGWFRKVSVPKLRRVRR